jgi:uncharacterized protein YxeA
MKLIMNAVVGILVVVVLYVIFFNKSTSSVTTPEIKRTGNYERPVKDGNCYLQKDSTGNKIRVCG